MEERLTLTVQEAAHILGVSRYSAYEAIRQEKLPHIHIGKRIVVPRAALMRLVGVESNPVSIIQDPLPADLAC
jgi:excisionase family DNA binding protein